MLIAIMLNVANSTSMLGVVMLNVVMLSVVAPCSSQLWQPGDFNMDPTVGIDGARPPPKYIFKDNMSLTNSKILPVQTRLFITQ
jgi:hypothetical protein